MASPHVLPKYTRIIFSIEGGGHTVIRPYYFKDLNFKATIKEIYKLESYILTSVLYGCNAITYISHGDVHIDPDDNIKIENF